MAVAIRCDSGIVCHHCTVWVAFSKCDLSLELVVAAALRYGVVILSSVLSGRAKLFFFSGCPECLRAFSCLLWPCFGLSLQDKPFVLWLMFVKVGYF